MHHGGQEFVAAACQVTHNCVAHGGHIHQQPTDALPLPSQLSGHLQPDYFLIGMAHVIWIRKNIAAQFW